MSHHIKAITFDLWDTVLVDDSDEPKRKALGLLPKPGERRRLVTEFLKRHGSISQETVNLAYDVTDAAFREVWYGQNVTWTVETRLSVLLNGLKCVLPKQELQVLIDLHEEMELKVKPDLAPGIVEAIEQLSQNYKLGVISDTIFSSGRVLRSILAEYDLLKYFHALVFSDEVGCSKPNPKVFGQAASMLGVKNEEIIHIGDREQKDIDGPHQVGAKGIYSTVVLDRGPCVSADAVCNDYAKLTEIIKGLN